MTNKNDKIILQTKKQIEEKKKLLTKVGKFNPITHCSLELYNIRYNLNVMNTEQIFQALGALKSIQESALEIGESSPKINGFTVQEWKIDLTSRYLILNQSIERERLKNLETKLHNLLSVETKVSLELEDLMKQI